MASGSDNFEATKHEITSSTSEGEVSLEGQADLPLPEELLHSTSSNSIDANIRDANWERVILEYKKSYVLQLEDNDKAQQTNYEKEFEEYVIVSEYDEKVVKKSFWEMYVIGALAVGFIPLVIYFFPSKYF